MSGSADVVSGRRLSISSKSVCGGRERMGSEMLSPLRERMPFPNWAMVALKAPVGSVLARATYWPKVASCEQAGSARAAEKAWNSSGGQPSPAMRENAMR